MAAPGPRCLRGQYPAVGPRGHNPPGPGSAFDPVRDTMLISQLTTATTMAPQKADQKPWMWNGRSNSPAIQSVSRKSSALTTNAKSPSVRM